MNKIEQIELLKFWFHNFETPFVTDYEKNIFDELVFEYYEEITCHGALSFFRNEGPSFLARVIRQDLCGLLFSNIRNDLNKSNEKNLLNTKYLENLFLDHLSVQMENKKKNNELIR